MSINMDKDLQAGVELLKEGKKIDAALKLINKSARLGTTKGKSFFEIGTILRDGIPGMEANPDEARKYFDKAMSLFETEASDSLDYREMGDYYYFGLGTKQQDKNLALEYYKKASTEDDLAKQRKEEIENQIQKGDSVSGPTLTPQTQVKDEENTPVNNEAEEEKKEETPSITVSPVVLNENSEADITDKVVAQEIDSDQILIKAIRILDSTTSTQQEKEDAVELAKIAAENGSIRACVLCAYLFEGDNSLVKQDLNKAKDYYELAIKNGSCSAKFRLGILYMDPNSAFYDLQKGHQLIIDSAHDGYSYALAYLGDCFRLKVDDARNLEVAYRYYALAGERGLGLGYHNMAEIDASRQQIDLAEKHEKLALSNGYDSALGYQDPLFYTLHI